MQLYGLDNRAQEEAEFFKEKFGDETCYKVTGQVSFEPCWPASKILWDENHEPGSICKDCKISADRGLLYLPYDGEVCNRRFSGMFFHLLGYY